MLTKEKHETKRNKKEKSNLRKIRRSLRLQSYRSDITISSVSQSLPDNLIIEPPAYNFVHFNANI